MGLSKSETQGRAAGYITAKGGGVVPELPLRRVLQLARGHDDGITAYLAVLTSGGLHVVGPRGRPPATVVRLIECLPVEPQRFVDDLADVARSAGLLGPMRYCSCAVFPVAGTLGVLHGGLYVFLRQGRRLDLDEMNTFREVAGLAGACLDFVAGASSAVSAPAASSLGLQQHLRPLFENATDIVFTQELSGRLTAVNSVGERLLGFRQEEFREMTLSDLVEPGQRQLAEQIILEQFGGGGSQSYELRFRTRSGGTLETQVTVHLLFFHGFPVGLIGFARDLTPRKVEQAARRETEERLARLEAEFEELSGYWTRLHELTVTRHSTFEDFARTCLRVACEAVGARLAVLAEGNDPAEALVRAVHPPETLELGARLPSHLVGIPNGALTDVQAEAVPPFGPAVMIPVRANSRSWGYLALSPSDPARTLSGQALRFAEFLASLISARLAENRWTVQPAGSTGELRGATETLKRLDRLVRTARETKRACSVVLVELRGAAISESDRRPVDESVMRLLNREVRSELGPERGHEVLNLGTDRWLVLLPGTGRRRTLLSLVWRIETALRDTVQDGGQPVELEAYCGSAIFPLDGNDAAALLQAAEAEIAARKAKAAPRMDYKAVATARLESRDQRLLNDLRQAFEQKQFCLRFQPQIQINGELLGFEALLTWNHPAFGPVPAAEFIDAVERSGLIVPLGSWVLDEACRVAARWCEAGHDLRKMAVNVSASQFRDPDFVEAVVGALDRHDLEPGLLELEVTERVAISDSQNATAILQRLRKLGVRLAIDDFGTGYSSLSYLTRLPVHTLKIDRSFLSDDTSEATARSTIEAIVGLAHKLGLTVVAEGVEKVRQWQMLRQAGCDSVQGHLFGHPLSEEAATQLLENRSRRRRS